MNFARGCLYSLRYLIPLWLMIILLILIIERLIR
jgi:hypothetical protein